MFIKSFVVLLFFFLASGTDLLCASTTADRLDDRNLSARMSVYLYPRTVADIEEFDLSLLGAGDSAPVELIYWAVGFKRESDGTVKAYQKSHNPDQDNEPFDTPANIILKMFERFPEARGYHHTWLLDTCLNKHARLMDEMRLLESFNEEQRRLLVRDVVNTFGVLAEETEHRPRAISVDIEPICQPDGSDSLLGFHSDLVTAINNELSIPVSVHMSCSKIHDWLIDPSRNTNAYHEFTRLVDAIRMHPQSYLIIDAYCHGNSCEHQLNGACVSCQDDHFTSLHKLQAIFRIFTDMEIPFKTVLSISGSSSGGRTLTGWCLENFRQSLARIKSGVDLTSPYLRGFAFYGVGSERRITGDLGSVLGALIDEGFVG